MLRDMKNYYVSITTLNFIYGPYPKDEAEKWIKIFNNNTTVIAVLLTEQEANERRK